MHTADAENQKSEYLGDGLHTVISLLQGFLRIRSIRILFLSASLYFSKRGAY